MTQSSPPDLIAPNCHELVAEMYNLHLMVKKWGLADANDPFMVDIADYNILHAGSGELPSMVVMDKDSIRVGGRFVYVELPMQDF